MGTFRELEEFERRFNAMDVAELERWKCYWTRHANQLAPKIRKQAMKQVYDIEKAIERKAAEEPSAPTIRSEEHTSELQSRRDLVCRLLLEKKKKNTKDNNTAQ